MAVTNFARLNSKQKIVWSRDVWSAARDQMFVKKFLGTGPGAWRRGRQEAAGGAVTGAGAAVENTPP